MERTRSLSVRLLSAPRTLALQRGDSSQLTKHILERSLSELRRLYQKPPSAWPMAHAETTGKGAFSLAVKKPASLVTACGPPYPSRRLGIFLSCLTLLPHLLSESQRCCGPCLPLVSRHPFGKQRILRTPAVALANPWGPSLALSPTAHVQTRCFSHRCGWSRFLWEASGAVCVSASFARPKPLSSGSGAGAGDDGQLLLPDLRGVPTSLSREGGRGSLGANTTNSATFFLTLSRFSWADVSSFAVCPKDRSGVSFSRWSHCRAGQRWPPCCRDGRWFTQW